MRIFYRYIFVVLWVLSGCILRVGAQEPVRIADVRVEPAEVTLGDHFDLVMEVEAQEGCAVAFPDLTKGVAGGLWEYISEQEVDTISRKEGVYGVRKRYRLTSFEPGDYSLDSLGVVYRSAEGGVDTLYALAPLEMSVGMIPIDTTQTTIYGVKPPMKAPLYAEEFTGYLALVVLLIALVASVVRVIYRLSRRDRVERVVVPNEQPHVVAIRRLERLHSQKLWQSELLKEYYTELTDILREYLDNRYGVNAPEMTSDEILSALRRLGIEERHYADLERLLHESDFVKFAKYTPEKEYHEEAYYKVYYFVEESKQVVITDEGPRSVSQTEE